MWLLVLGLLGKPGKSCHSGLQGDFDVESCAKFCRADTCGYCKCRACTVCALSPPPPPPPPPAKCSSNLSGDFTHKSCAKFCKPSHGAQHCAYCKCRSCGFCQPPPSPPPPPPPAQCSTNLQGDFGHKACAVFCKPERARQHCSFCKCQDCPFCKAPAAAAARLGEAPANGGAIHQKKTHKKKKPAASIADTDQAAIGAALKNLSRSDPLTHTRASTCRRYVNGKWTPCH